MMVPHRSQTGGARGGRGDRRRCAEPATGHREEGSEPLGQLAQEFEEAGELAAHDVHRVGKAGQRYSVEVRHCRLETADQTLDGSLEGLADPPSPLGGSRQALFSGKETVLRPLSATPFTPWIMLKAPPSSPEMSKFGGSFC